MIWLPPIFETWPAIQRVALVALRTTIPGAIKNGPANL